MAFQRCWKSRDRMRLHAGMLEAALTSVDNFREDMREHSARRQAIRVIMFSLENKSEVVSLRCYIQCWFD